MAYTAGRTTSVIIPVYNGEATLEEQLAALGRQASARALEVLVCDNGSTDGTRVVVERWASRLPGLRLIDASARRGPSHARNCGIVAATGQLLAFCDADDVVADDWVEQLQRHAKSGVILSGWNESGRLNPGHQGDGESIGRDLILREGYLFGIDSANVGLLKEDAMRIGGFDESCRYVEDVDFAWRAQLAGMTVESVPALVHTRLRTSAASVFKQRRNWGRYSILLKVRHQSLHPMPMSFRYSVTHAIRRIVALPVVLVSSDRSRRHYHMGALGALLGELSGHVRYRFFQAVPRRVLISPGD